MHKVYRVLFIWITMLKEIISGTSEHSSFLYFLCVLNMYVYVCVSVQ
jgi:hypothetical protein